MELTFRAINQVKQDLNDTKSQFNARLDHLQDSSKQMQVALVEVVGQIKQIRQEMAQFGHSLQLSDTNLVKASQALGRR